MTHSPRWRLRDRGAPRSAVGASAWESLATDSRAMLSRANPRVNQPWSGLDLLVACERRRIGAAQNGPDTDVCASRQAGGYLRARSLNGNPERRHVLGSLSLEGLGPDRTGCDCVLVPRPLGLSRSPTLAG